MRRRAMIGSRSTSSGGRARRNRLIPLTVIVFVVAGVLVSSPRIPAAGAAVAQLKRSPYLTDLVGTSVAVNWATDRSATSASASWGAVGSGGCTPTNSVSAQRTSITVGTVSEYQW